MKVSVLFLFLLVAVAYPSFAQYREPPKGSQLSDRIYFGGGGGFSGGTQFLNLSISPLVGYKFTEEFSGGLQLSYQYIRFAGASASNYGGGPFLRYNFTEKIFGYTQYEYLNFGLIQVNSSNKPERLDFNSWFIGLGYTEPLGGKVAFNIMALYNLLYADGINSPYQSPLQFRVGIVVGL